MNGREKKAIAIRLWPYCLGKMNVKTTLLDDGILCFHLLCLRHNALPNKAGSAVYLKVYTFK